MLSDNVPLCVTLQTAGIFTDHDIDELLADIQQQVMQEIEDEVVALERAEQQDKQLTAAMAEDHFQHLQSAGVLEGS